MDGDSPAETPAAAPVQPAGNILTRVVGGVVGGAYTTTTAIAGGAYNATTNIIGGVKNNAVPVVGATTSAVIGGASWLTGAALSSSVGLVKGVGTMVLPAKLTGANKKDKSE